MRLLHGVAPASRFHLYSRQTRDFQSVNKLILKVLKEVLEVNCSLFFLRRFLPEESAWLGRFSLLNLLESFNLYLYLGS